jgi:hypothetical protein
MELTKPSNRAVFLEYVMRRINLITYNKGKVLANSARENLIKVPGPTNAKILMDLFDQVEEQHSQMFDKVSALIMSNQLFTRMHGCDMIMMDMLLLFTKLFAGHAKHHPSLGPLELGGGHAALMAPVIQTLDEFQSP